LNPGGSQKARHQGCHPAEIEPHGDNPLQKRLYRQRNCIERVIGHLKINRAVARRQSAISDENEGAL
jgi:hypothetical protein